MEVQNEGFKGYPKNFKQHKNKKRRIKMRFKSIFVVLIFTSILLVLSQPTLAGNNNVEDLFMDTEFTWTMNINSGDSDSKTIRSRCVEIRFEQIFSEAQSDQHQGCPSNLLQLNLFPDAFFIAQLDRVQKHSSGAVSWIGFIQEDEKSNGVVLTIKDNMMFGSISTSRETYLIRHIGDGIHEIQQTDQSRYPECKEPIPVYSENKVEDVAAGDDGSMIDVMVVYTDDARAAVGDTASMQVLIDQAIAETNTGYSNSGVNQRVRLVHTAEVSYNESGFDWNQTLNRLRDPSDGYMDNVHVLRDTYAADEVVLLVNDDSYCGLAYLMTNVSPGFESSAFSLVHWDCAVGYYSFAHEMGHNMSARHDRFVDNEDYSPFTYNHGYVYLTGGWRTIMAYNNECGFYGFYCTRINYWSNPNVLYNDVPTGVSGGEGIGADNRQTLNNTAFTVANFRQSVSITVNSPNGGEKLQIGSPHNITWDEQGVGNLKITLWKDGIKLGTIADDVSPSPGSYTWTVGDYSGGPASTGTGYTIKISEKGTAVSDTSDAPFDIIDLTVTSPDGGESLTIGSQHNITWTAQGVGNLKITLWKDGVKLGTIVDNVPPSPGSYDWTVGDYSGGPASQGTGYKIKISEKGAPASDISDGPFELTDEKELTVTSPIGGENLPIGSQHNITWDAQGVGNLKITLWQGGTKLGTIVDNLSPSSGSYAWTVGDYIGGPALPGTGYKIKISEKGSTVSDTSDGPFTITGITVISPNGGEDWSIGSFKDITWAAQGVGDLKITLWQGETKLGTIADNVPSSPGSYTWTVGDYIGGTASPGSGYKIKISEKGTPVSDTSDTSFTLY
jgi:hypothetical protein